VFSWKRTFESVFMARSSPPGLCNVNNLAGNLFPERSAHIPPSNPHLKEEEPGQAKGPTKFLFFLGQSKVKFKWSIGHHPVSTFQVPPPFAHSSRNLKDQRKMACWPAGCLAALIIGLALCGTASAATNLW